MLPHRTPAAASSLLLVTLLLAPAVLMAMAPSVGAQGSAAQEPRLTDREGDAREDPLLTPALMYAGRLTGTRTTLGNQLVGTNQPALDIRALDLHDTPEHLVVELTVTGIPEDLSGLVSPDNRQGSYLAACWSHLPDRACTQVVMLALLPAGNSTSIASIYETRQPLGDRTDYFDWRVAYEIDHGAPATVRWFVPRQLLPGGEAGTGVRDFIAEAARVSIFHGEDSHYHSAVLSGRAHLSYGIGDVSNWVVDVGFSDNEYVFATPPTDAPIPTTAATIDPVGDVFRGERYRSEIDILEGTFLENATHVSYALSLARVHDEIPEDVGVYLTLRTPDRATYWIHFSPGEAGNPMAARCEQGQCDDAVSFRPLITLEPGTPGRLIVGLPRSEFEVRAGDLLDSVQAGVYTAERHASTERGIPAGHPLAGLPQNVDLVSATGADWTNVVWPYVIGTNTELPPLKATDGNLLRLTDDMGDVAPPRLGPGAASLRAEDYSRFDIVSLRSESPTPSAIRLTLGLKTTRGLGPTLGYDQALYAVALDTDAGRMVVALSKEPRKPYLSFCGDDTVVFVEDPADRQNPVETFRQQIEAIVASDVGADTGANQTGTVGAGATITFVIPLSCFGLDGPRPLQVNRISAAAYVIRGPAGPDALGRSEGALFDELDRLEGEGPFEPLTWAAAPTPVAPGLWDTLLTTENLLNLVGLLVAAVSSIIGLLLMRRRRNALRRYLAEVDRAAEEDPHNPATREAGLVAIRARLKGDLLRGRLSEAHYVVVERRIDEHLSRTRLTTLAEAFGDLPHRLLLKLQDLLVDGRMTREDLRFFSALLEDTSLTEDAKARVRRKLEHWVAADVEGGAPAATAA